MCHRKTNSDLVGVTSESEPHGFSTLLSVPCVRLLAHFSNKCRHSNQEQTAATGQGHGLTALERPKSSSLEEQAAHLRANDPTCHSPGALLTAWAA